MAWVLLAPALLLPITQPAAPSEPTTGPQQIIIGGEGDLTAENGVVGGDGSPTHPYVIEDLVLSANATRTIWVWRTTAHILIRNITFRDTVGYGAAVRIEHAQNVAFDHIGNGTVPYSVLIQGSSGIRLADSPGGGAVRIWNSQDISITRSQMVGLEVVGSTGVAIEDSASWFSSESYGLRSISDSRDVRLRNLTSNTSLSLRDSEDLVVEASRFAGAGAHIVVRNCTHLRIEGTRIEDQEGLPFQIQSGTDIELRGNTFIGGEYGPTTIQRVDGLTAEGNNFSGGLDMKYLSREQWAAVDLANTNRVDGAPVDFHALEDGLSLEGLSGVHLLVAASNHVTVANSTFASLGSGVGLFQVEDARLTNVSFANPSSGMRFLGVRRAVVADSSFDNSGFSLASTDAVSVTAARFSGVAFMSVEGTNGTVIRGNRFADESHGVVSFYDTNLTLADNELGGGADLFGTLWGTLWEGQDWSATISNNTVRGGLPLRVERGCSNFSADGGAIGQLYLLDCTNVTLRDLTFDGLSRPLFLGNVTGASIAGNSFANAIEGVTIMSSRDVKFDRNQINTSWRALTVDSTNGFSGDGNRFARASATEPSNYASLVSISSVAAGSLSDTNISCGGGLGLAIGGAPAFRVGGATITGCRVGIAAANSPGGSIDRASIAGGATGIWVDNTNGFWIGDNTLSGQTEAAIEVHASENVSVRDNNLTAANGVAAALNETISVVFADNDFHNGTLRFLQYGGDVIPRVTWSNNQGTGAAPLLFYDGCRDNVISGITARQLIFQGCSNIRVENVTVQGPGAEIVLLNVSGATLMDVRVTDSLDAGVLVAESDRVNIVSSRIERNRIGVEFWGAPEVSMHGNAFIDNEAHTSGCCSGHFVTSDAGFQGGGNFWSGYPGVDECGGRRQDVCTGPDGYGDTSADSWGEADHYPLMAPPGDDDGDGMANAWEVAAGLDAKNAADAAADADHDGLSNLREYHLGTHPQRADTDGDGVRDGDDNEPWRFNPGIAGTSPLLALLVGTFALVGLVTWSSMRAADRRAAAERASAKPGPASEAKLQ